MAPAPTPRHQIIQWKLGTEISDYIRKYDLGIVMYAPVDVYLSKYDTYQPDIVFVAKENAHLIGDEKIEGAPDLVVEILSPSSAYDDLKRKWRVYERSGVKEYWIVDPKENSIEIYENVNREFKRISRAFEKDVVTSKILKGLKVDLKEVF